MIKYASYFTFHDSYDDYLATRELKNKTKQNQTTQTHTGNKASYSALSSRQGFVPTSQSPHVCAILVLCTGLGIFNLYKLRKTPHYLTHTEMDTSLGRHACALSPASGSHQQHTPSRALPAVSSAGKHPGVFGLQHIFTAIFLSTFLNFTLKTTNTMLFYKHLI